MRSSSTALLLSIALASPTALAQDLFVDITEESGLDFVHFNGMTGEFYFAEMVGSGAALFDYDADGDLDLYLVQGRMLGGHALDLSPVLPQHPMPLTDRLYRNDSVRGRDGSIRNIRFTDVTDESGIESTTGYGMGVAVGDYDDDGLPDLYITNYGSNQLLRNRGDGTFEDVTAAAGVDDDRWSIPAAFLDYDADGDLDLYVGNYVAWTEATQKPCRSTTSSRDYCSPKTFPPESDRLFRNDGNGRFTNVTAAAGLTRAFGPGLGVVVTDFDGDEDLDLFVANDGAANQLWINRGNGTFDDDGPLAGVSVNMDGMPEASMGVDAADIDGDGDEDLFMTHLKSETNTLYVNDGSGWFEDRTIDLGLAGPSVASTGFGTRFIDYDNDGHPDILAVNGAVTLVAEQIRAGEPFPMLMPNQLFRNQGDGSFVEVTAEAGAAFETAEVSRGVAVGDLDDDGDIDIVITNNSGVTRVLRNDVGADNGWLGLALYKRGARVPTSGAHVRLDCGDDRVRARRSRSEGSYVSSADPRIVFGLGEARIRSCDAEVLWPDGTRQSLTDLSPGRYHRVDQP